MLYFIKQAFSIMFALHQKISNPFAFFSYSPYFMPYFLDGQLSTLGFPQFSSATAEIWNRNKDWDLRFSSQKMSVVIFCVVMPCILVHNYNTSKECTASIFRDEVFQLTELPLGFFLPKPFHSTLNFYSTISHSDLLRI